MGFLKRIATYVTSTVVYYYEEYPARTTAVAISAIVAIAGAFGVSIAPQNVEGILKVIIPILFTGELTHHRVTPVI